MSLTPRLQARTYSVLVQARQARGERLQTELQRRVQAHAAQQQLVEQAQHAQAQALQAFEAGVRKLCTRLTSRQALQVDEVLRLRAQRETLEEKHHQSILATGQAEQGLRQCTDDCREQRRLIAANDEQVKSLQDLRDKALATHAQSAEDAEEDEREEVYASALMRAAS